MINESFIALNSFYRPVTEISRVMRCGACPVLQSLMLYRLLRARTAAYRYVNLASAAAFLCAPVSDCSLH